MKGTKAFNSIFCIQWDFTHILKPSEGTVLPALDYSRHYDILVKCFLRCWKINNWKAILKTQKKRFWPHFLKFLEKETQTCKVMFFYFKRHIYTDPVILANFEKKPLTNLFFHSWFLWSFKYEVEYMVLHFQ